MPEFSSHSNDLWEVVPVPNASEKLCSLVLCLPVESFRTKGLPALPVQHTPKEQTCLLWLRACFVTVCTYNLHSCRPAFLQTPLFPPSATRKMIFRIDQVKPKQKRQKSFKMKQFLHKAGNLEKKDVPYISFSIHMIKLLWKCLALGNGWGNKYLHKYCSILSGKLSHNKMYKTLQFTMSHTERCLCWSPIHLRYLSPSWSTPLSPHILLLSKPPSLYKFFEVIFKEW